MKLISIQNILAIIILIVLLVNIDHIFYSDKYIVVKKIIYYTIIYIFILISLVILIFIFNKIYLIL